jgi:hypothetical protein
MAVSFFTETSLSASLMRRVVSFFRSDSRLPATMAAAGCPFVPCKNCSMSLRVIFFPGKAEASAVASTLPSAMIFRARGVASVTVALCTGAGSAFLVATGAEDGLSFFVFPTSIASITAITAPTGMVSPSDAFRVILPETSAVMGKEALSESISATSWSLSTSSPSVTSHLASWTWVIDSPGLGIFISTGIKKSFQHIKTEM